MELFMLLFSIAQFSYFIPSYEYFILSAIDWKQFTFHYWALFHRFSTTFLPHSTTTSSLLLCWWFLSSTHSPSRLCNCSQCECTYGFTKNIFFEEQEEEENINKWTSDLRLSKKVFLNLSKNRATSEGKSFFHIFKHPTIWEIENWNGNEKADGWEPRADLYF